jgi:hypothetical protein
MNLPIVVRVLGKIYDIIPWTPGADDKELALVQNEFCSIGVKGDIADDQKLEAIWHEIIHIIDAELKLKLTENQIRRLSCVQFEVLRNNHGLINAIKRE